jgi:hypothetical protein
MPHLIHIANDFRIRVRMKRREDLLVDLLPHPLLFGQMRIGRNNGGTVVLRCLCGAAAREDKITAEEGYYSSIHEKLIFPVLKNTADTKRDPRILPSTGEFIKKKCLAVRNIQKVPTARCLTLEVKCAQQSQFLSSRLHKGGMGQSWLK